MAQNNVLKKFQINSAIILTITFFSLLILSLAFGNFKTNAQSANDIYLIDESKVVFSPDRSNAPVFAKGNANAASGQDLTVTVTDSRITTGATCDIQIRPWPTSSNPNPTFSATSLTNVNASYDVNGCRATLSKANQATYLWEFQIRITSGGIKYGVDTSYFFLFGAAVLVDIKAAPQS